MKTRSAGAHTTRLATFPPAEHALLGSVAVLPRPYHGQQDRPRMLEAILNSIGDAVVVADENGKLLLVNPAAERLIGIGMTDASPAEWPARYGVFLPDGSTPFPWQDLPLVRAIRGEACDEELFVLNPQVPDGVHLTVSGRPLMDERGALRGGVAVFRDITERNRMEEALRESEDRYRSLVEACPDAVTLTDLSGRVLLCNRRAVELHGFRSVDEALGRIAFEFIAPEDRSRAQENMQKTLKSGEVRDVEYTLLRKDGERFAAELSASVTSDAEGRPRAFTAVIRDITDRKRAEEALRRARDELEQRVHERTAELSKSNALLRSEIRERKRAEETLARRAEELARSNADLEQFAYVASHDLKEPLRMVTSYVELLERRYKGRLDADADEFIGYAVEGAMRMQSLIDGLLAYSRVRTHGQPFKAVDCELALERTLTNLRETIRESGAAVTHDALPTVVGDETQIDELLQNLIANSIKFHSGGKPKVHVQARRRAGEWLFSVSDDSIGIDPRHAERIFVIFQRLHSREKYPGTGIGLAICKKIVDRHGGRIWVESQPGQGATFYFTIPRKETKAWRTATTARPST